MNRADRRHVRSLVRKYVAGAVALSATAAFLFAMSSEEGDGGPAQLGPAPTVETRQP